MMNEWTDRLSDQEAGEVRRRAGERIRAEKVRAIEKEIGRDAANGGLGAGVSEALRAYMALRKTLFPGLPSDIPLAILSAIAEFPEGDARTSITAISHGAGVPQTSILRYLAIMEQQGIVERMRLPGDNRQVLIRLTSEGRRQLDQIIDRLKVRALLALIVPAGMLIGAWQILAA